MRYVASEPTGVSSGLGNFPAAAQVRYYGAPPRRRTRGTCQSVSQRTEGVAVEIAVWITIRFVVRALVSFILRYTGNCS